MLLGDALLSCHTGIEISQLNLVNSIASTHSGALSY